MDTKMDNKNTINLDNVDKVPNGDNLTLKSMNNNRLLSRNRTSQAINMKVIKRKS